MDTPRWFEDFTVGRVYELGSHTVTEDEIIAFARQFDPQPFHVDPVAALASSFGGLIASGWHTGAIWMRLYADAVLAGAASMGSPGMEDLRWLRPVRPGDTLTGTLTIEDATPSSRRPDRGTLHILSELTNQDGDVVYRSRGRGMFGRRPADPADPADPAQGTPTTI